jgi:hypothetical protein
MYATYIYVYIYREWRKSEDMKRKILKKYRGRGRLLGIINILEKNGKKAKSVSIMDSPYEDTPPPSGSNFDINYWLFLRIDMLCFIIDDNDVYLNKLQTKGIKKSILYM